MCKNALFFSLSNSHSRLLAVLRPLTAAHWCTAGLPHRLTSQTASLSHPVWPDSCASGAGHSPGVRRYGRPSGSDPPVGSRSLAAGTPDGLAVQPHAARRV